MIPGDLNGDGKLDLAIPDYGYGGGANDTFDVLLGNGDGTFQAPMTYAARQGPQGTLADFNGDGRLDFAVVSYPENMLSIQLQATGPLAVLSPTSLNFGTQLADTTSSLQSVTLSNIGIATLDISSIVASNGFFELSNCDSSLAVGAQCNINVFFSPRTAGTITGTVTITDNASDSPQTVSLAGAGTIVGLSPTGLNLYTQTVGTTSAAQTITMTNHGYRTLTVGFGLRGSNPGDFAQTNTCGNSWRPERAARSA